MSPPRKIRIRSRTMGVFSCHVPLNLDQFSISLFKNMAHKINQARCLSKYPMFWISLLLFSQAQIRHHWQECHLGEGVVFPTAHDSRLPLHQEAAFNPSVKFVAVRDF